MQGTLNAALLVLALTYADLSAHQAVEERVLKADGHSKDQQAFELSQTAPADPTFPLAQRKATPKAGSAGPIFDFSNSTCVPNRARPGQVPLQVKAASLPKKADNELPGIEFSMIADDRLEESELYKELKVQLTGSSVREQGNFQFRSGDTHGEKSVVAIRSKDDPTRQIFLVKYSHKGHDEIGGHPVGAKEVPTAVMDHFLVFDNRGNAASVWFQQELPPGRNKIFSTQFVCYGPSQKDGFGFFGLGDSDDIYFNADAPILPLGVRLDELPLLNEDSPFSERLVDINDPAKRKALGEKILADRNSLSRDRRDAAEGMRDGTYKESATWKLREAIFSQFPVKKASP